MVWVETDLEDDVVPAALPWISSTRPSLLQDPTWSQTLPGHPQLLWEKAECLVPQKLAEILAKSYLPFNNFPLNMCRKMLSISNNPGLFFL